MREKGWGVKLKKYRDERLVANQAMTTQRLCSSVEVQSALFFQLRENRGKGKDISSSNAVEAVDRPFTIGTLASLKANRMTTCAFVVNLIRSPASLALLKTGHLTVGGRRAICREWFPDAHRSYCERCLSPGHHQIMCRNQSVCKYCRAAHL